MPVRSASQFFDLIPCPFEGLRMYIAIKYGFPIMFPMLGWYGTWLPKRKPIKMTFCDTFVVDEGKSIEENRIEYYCKINSTKYIALATR